MSFYGDYSVEADAPDAETLTYAEGSTDGNGLTYADTHNFEDQYEAEPEKDQVTGIANLNMVPHYLRVWNIMAFIFQFLQAGALGYLASEATTKWPIYVNFPANFDERDATFGIPEPKQIASFSVTWYSCVFIALSGIDHLVVCFPGMVDKYNYYIARHQNPFRWTEYAFSASLMRVMIAQLSGVTDLHILFGIYCLAAITMVMGSVHESVNAVARADGYRQNWYPFLAAFIPHLASWFIIMCYFFVAVSRGDPPIFVWLIIWILFVLDGVFALLFYLQWGKIWIFKDYVKGEIAFIILSFTAKSALAWINFGGGLR